MLNIILAYAPLKASCVVPAKLKIRGHITTISNLRNYCEKIKKLSNFKQFS
jgi:hypothetical protein